MKKLLNDRWEFLKLPLNSTLEEAQSSLLWQHVDLPHDWLIWQSHDLYESADAWYRRELVFGEIPECCLLSFDGVYMDCDILLNGDKICSHAYGYTAFYASLTGRIRPGRNELMVHIRHQSPNSRWYSGSGIFRDVFLLELPENHIIPDSFYLKETKCGNEWELEITAETFGTDSGLFLCAAKDSAGNEIAKGSAQSVRGRIELTLRLNGVQVWDVDNPVLYKLEYSYGKEKGEKRFGIRSTEYSPEKGFLLNGKQLKLKGVCLHHDLGALGAAFHEKAAKRQLQLMKDMGANALRTSHNPPASKMLDLCDEMGILVVDEAFDMWEYSKTTYDYARFFNSHEAEDVSLWIRRDRCHPCVILWSIGNEIFDMHAGVRGAEICAMLMNQVMSHDPKGHAAVTFGSNYMPWEGGQRCADIVKVAGYNYGEKYYEEHHRNNPDWVIYGSETASVLSSRGIYHFPAEKSIMSEADLQCSALGNSNTSWGAEDLRAMIVNDLKCTFSMGQFIWSGIDYIGEPTPYHTRSCYFGQADTACFPKDSFFLFQSLWSRNAVLHIGVYWDWNPGQLIDVPVMTNYNRVELLLNGKSLGIRDVKRNSADRCLPVWKVPYEAGELRARALDTDGSILGEDVRRTPGNTAKLILTKKKKKLKSDGRDLAFITVLAEDKDGYPVENARDRVTVTVSGGAYLIGTDNGDSTDPDGYKQNSRRLFGGKLLVIISSDGCREDVTVRAVSTEGIAGEISIPVIPSEIIPGTSCCQRIHETAGNRRIPVRKIEICAEGSRELTRENPVCICRWKQLPEYADGQPVIWQVTNEAGIVVPYAEAEPDGNRIRVTAKGDGHFYLRALGGNAVGHPEIISQLEFTANGIGKPLLNPYEFISAGLYDIHKGDIGTGNEKGIAFSRDGESMVGFSRVDFGKAGSDTLILPIFALNGDMYEIEMIDGIPETGGKVISLLCYQKPSIWNCYQEEVYHLPVRLTGIHTICFRMKDKVHMKGFRFEKQSRAGVILHAGEADSVYGDSFVRDGHSIVNIGNNVTLIFDEMDFGDTKDWTLMIRGKTRLQINSVTVRFRNQNMETVNEVADFLGNGCEEQFFRMHTPGGLCSVAFVFLPGSDFDFEAFQFRR